LFDDFIVYLENGIMSGLKFVIDLSSLNLQANQIEATVRKEIRGGLFAGLTA
jgi:hypothetical protein